MFKEYEKKYEGFFDNERTFKNTRIDRITADGFDALESYQLTLKDNLHNFQLSIFNYLVKIYWLFKKFKFDGVIRSSMNKNGYMVDMNFKKFMTLYCGYDNKLITGNKFFSIIIDYFYDFFPDFDVNNPFEDKYEYPYKYMNFECLIAVYKLDDRLKLLKIGEDRNMTFPVFFDYVFNHIMSINEENKKDIYTVDHIDRSVMKFLYFKKIKYE